MKYKTLNDAADHLHKEALNEGKTEIWYMKPEYFNDFIMSSNYLKKHDLLPTMLSLDETHVLLGSIQCDNLEYIFNYMQGENWSPNGEARELIEHKGLSHTSMSVGDIIIRNGQLFMVDKIGFFEINV